MRKILLVAVSLSTVTAFGAQQLQQLLDKETDHSIAEFCEFIELPQGQQQEFIRFYETRAKKHQRIKSASRRQSRAQQQRDKGRSALEVEQPDVYAQLTALEKKSETYKNPKACVAQNARFFLTRYSAWHDYKKSQAESQASLWQKVKGAAHSSTQRIAQWFGKTEPVTVASN